jgi:hypothetical protein
VYIGRTGAGACGRSRRAERGPRAVGHAAGGIPTVPIAAPTTANDGGTFIKDAGRTDDAGDCRYY